MAGQELPDDVVKALENSNEAQLKHRWMYSFMPLDMLAYSNTKYTTDVFLVGYCPTCDTSVSVLVPVAQNGSTQLSRSNIPKWGCVPVQEL